MPLLPIAYMNCTHWHRDSSQFQQKLWSPPKCKKMQCTCAVKTEVMQHAPSMQRQRKWGKGNAAGGREGSLAPGPNQEADVGWAAQEQDSPVVKLALACSLLHTGHRCGFVHSLWRNSCTTPHLQCCMFPCPVMQGALSVWSTSHWACSWAALHEAGARGDSASKRSSRRRRQLQIVQHRRAWAPSPRRPCKLLPRLPCSDQLGQVGRVGEHQGLQMGLPSTH